MTFQKELTSIYESHSHLSVSEGYFWLEMLRTGFAGCKMATLSANAINPYLNAIVVYLGFIEIHFYFYQNKIQISDFVHFP